MKLKDFFEDYQSNAKIGRDIFHAFWNKESPNGKKMMFDLSQDYFSSEYEARRNKEASQRAELLNNADLIKAEVYESPASSFGGKTYTLKIWSAELDADQAQIALGIHPLLRAKPSKKARRAK